MSRALRYLSDRSGHTLIELMTVLVLILLVASFVVPSMDEYVGRNKTRRALDRVVNDVAFARMTAIRAGERSLVAFTGSGYTVGLRTEVDSVLKSVSLSTEYPGIEVTPPNDEGELVFDSRGVLVGGQAGAIIVTMGSAVDSAIVTAAGRVYRDF